jgi:hypothetical protein
MWRVYIAFSRPSHWLHVQRQWREFLQKAAKKTKIAIGFKNPSFSLFPPVNLLLSANGFEAAVL